MKEENEITKAQLARDLGVSRAYITMIANGERKPSRQFIDKVKNVYYVNNVNSGRSNNFTLNQQVQGSIPWRLTR